MPAKSKAQFKKMAGCAHNPDKMKGKCPPEAVAEEFVKATKNYSKLPAKKGKK